MYSRREACSVTALSVAMILQSANRSNSMPARSDASSLPDLLIRIQEFPPPLRYKTDKALKGALVKRFIGLANSQKTEVSSEGKQTLEKIIDEGLPRVFEKRQSGPIDKSKKFENLPISLRQAITFRNLHSIADASIYVAIENEKKIGKRVITAEIIQSVRDFFCPMYPFCTG